MYNRYANSLYSRDRYHRYPSYGYYDDNFVDYREPDSWIDYYYGGNRYYPYYWDRDDYSRYRRREARRQPETARIEAPSEKLAEALKVLDVNAHAKKNGAKHHTSKYECVREEGQPVVRRGDTMEVTITFDREYDIEKTDAKIVFFTGKNASQPKGMKATMKLVETEKTSFKPDEWGSSLVKKNGNDITIQIHIPVNCIIGRWNMIIKTFVKGKDENGKEKDLIFNYEYKQDVIILFNPWCKDDTVSMTPEENLKEYILSDVGFVFVGYWKWPSARPWSFAQFHKGILDAALYLLNAAFGGEPSKSMSDPIQVSRVMAKMVNVQDDNGLLVGNWSGDYTGGTPPTKWVGSHAIIQEFMKNKEPVKYGQCWVYSALLTTVCRALGIPCRSVTNFASAHDTEGSATIDKFFDTNDEPLERMNHDSIWNFHVWNEAWLARPDLDEKSMNGWNVIDATPQELSDGVYTCGPCPVAAVKKGMCNIPYDTVFVYAEVNADEVHWTVLPNGDLKRKLVLTDELGFLSRNISSCPRDVKEMAYKGLVRPILEYASPVWDPSGKTLQDELEKVQNRAASVGKSLYTKDPRYDPTDASGTKGLNVTHEYKFEEGSVEERNAALMAHKTAKLKRDVYTTEHEKAEIEFHLIHEDAMLIGDDLEIHFTAKHNGDYERTVKVAKITVSPKLYTGRIGKAFFRKEFDDFDMVPKDEKKLSVTLKMSDYLPHLVEGAYVYITATAHVQKFERRGRTRQAQTVYKGHDFKFTKPDLQIEGSQMGKLGKPMTFTVSFKNPLNTPLTQCTMSIESSGFDDQSDVKLKDVPVGALFKEKFTLTPVAAGELLHTVLFSFDCKELVDITGYTAVSIEDDTEEN